MFLISPKDIDTSFRQLRCVGSSHGWIAFTQENSDKPFLLNSFSKTRIRLPSMHTFSGSNRSKIGKLVLCSDPSHDDNYTVVAMHSAWLRTRIAFCWRGDDKWTDLRSEIETCYDIVCCDVMRSAFLLWPGPKVEVWDFSVDFPSRKALIQGSCPSKLARSNKIFPPDLYTLQWYLALSGLGQMHLVARYIGEFVRYAGGMYIGFHVFKYDHFDVGKKWVEVESLDDCALFLGGNQLMMVKTTRTNGEVKGNAIYFTDDYWDRMDEDYSYGGHDMGIFNMEYGRIVPVLETEESKIVPPPVWINNV